MSAYVHTGTATTAAELRITRMLSALAAGGVNNGFMTQLSPLAAAEAHGLDRAAADEFQRTLIDLDLINRKYESLEGNPVDEVLYLSDEGKNVLSQFRRIGARGSDVRSERYLAATRAILRWRDSDDGRAVLDGIKETPYGFFYGDPLQEYELLDAFDDLVQKDLLWKFGSFQDRTFGLALTPRGKQCVVRYDADIEEFERAGRSNSVSHTYNVGNVGNFVAGDNHGTMNAWTQVQSPQEAASLLAAAVKIASLNGDFDEKPAQDLAKECHHGLIEAANGSPAPEVRKRLADKVKALAMLAATKSAETATTVLASQGVTALLAILQGAPPAA